jgi:hypothetical protein
MEKNKRFMMGTLALMLVFGLVLAGCKTDADDDPIPITFATFTGDYDFTGAVAGKLAVDGAKGTLTFDKTTISGVTIADGGSLQYSSAEGELTGTWFYLVKDKDNIGIVALMSDGTQQGKVICLGTVVVAGFKSMYTLTPEPKNITDGTITGMGNGLH